MRLLALTAALAVTAAPVLTLPQAAHAGPELWQGAMDNCLAPIERIEDSAECLAAFIEVCVTEAIEMGEAEPDIFCTLEETKAWEAKMTASMAIATERATGIGAAEALAAGQAAWVAFRDAECALSGALAAPDAVSESAMQSCVLRETMRRFIRIEEVAQGGY